MHTDNRKSSPLATKTLAFATLLAASLISIAPLQAQTATSKAKPVRGTFVLVPEKSDDIDQAIEAGVKDMGMTKSIAKGRLKDTNPLYRTIEIDATADTVRLTFDGKTTLVAPANGEEIEWRYRGEKFKVTTRWEGNSVRQAFKAFDGTRENVTTLDPDGVTLRVVTTVTSSMLPEPVKYVMVYRREKR